MTIEERAFKKYPKHSDSEMESEMVSPRRNAYIANCKEQRAIDENEWKNKIDALKKWLSNDDNDAIVNEGQMGFVDIYDLLMFINNGL